MREPLNLARYAELAKNQCTPVTWDYISAGSEDESTLAYNRIAFSRWVLKPRVLSGCTEINLAVSLFGQTLSAPILLAPIGYQGLIHSEAELATVRGANSAQSLMIVSTMSNCSLETIAKESLYPLWFQLYCMKDPELTLSLIRRAEEAGYSALVITIDAPRLGRRERDLIKSRERMCQLIPGNLSQETIQKLDISSFNTMVEELFDSAMDWNTISWLKNQTTLPIVLKGILSAEDAKKAVALGVDGLIVSNHGGRQLDCAPASLDVLPEIVEAVRGQCKILIDGGIRRGTDILKAGALGADAVLIGRPVLWGLIYSGIQGVEHILTILKNELEHAMFLSGQLSWEKVDSSLISINYSAACCTCRFSLQESEIK